MHPSELMSKAFVAAALAERDGFKATAEALKFLATTCAAEARELLKSPSIMGRHSAADAADNGFRSFEVIR